jgi:hypothetical protein
MQTTEINGLIFAPKTPEQAMNGHELELLIQGARLKTDVRNEVDLFSVKCAARSKKKITSETEIINYRYTNTGLSDGTCQ